MITLITDFGLQDGYVAAMKGVIATLAPEVPVVDISHEIPPQAVRRAGLVLAQAAPFFPRGTVHVAVVDPGVGSRRKILAARAGGAIYLAPDNGLLSFALERRQVRAVHEVRCRGLFRHPVSSTFHGRDIFAPVAAHLARGFELAAVGPPARSYRWEGLPRVKRRRRGPELVLEGEVLDLDRFGNAVTNIRPPRGWRLVELDVRGLRLGRLSASYASVRTGKPLAVVGSRGTVEVAVSGGSAARELGLGGGEPVRTRWRA